MYSISALSKSSSGGVIKRTLNGIDSRITLRMCSPTDASFSRSDGCEVERWKNVEPLLSQVT